MKSIQILSFVLMFFGIQNLTFAQLKLSSGSENDISNAPDFKWETQKHDFGKIPQGKPVAVTFTFTNTGKAPLIISQAKGSCECTTAEFSPAPIPPGKTGSIKAMYDASKPGSFTKFVTITANNDGGPVQVEIKGEVIAKK